MSDKKVEIVGSVAKFPDDTPVKKCYNFLENVENLPKSRVWYIMVERGESGLQLARYQPNRGVNLEQVGITLKEMYAKVLPRDLAEKVEEMEVSGKDKFVYIRNIPECSVNGTPLISMIVEDLVSLLSPKKNKK